jgi:hypothetical protein
MVYSAKHVLALFATLLLFSLWNAPITFAESDEGVPEDEQEFDIAENETEEEEPPTKPVLTKPPQAEEAQVFAAATAAETRVLTATNTWKTFEDGSGSAKYANNLLITWQINAQNPFCIVLVQFEFIHLEDGYDTIQIISERQSLGDVGEVGPIYASAENVLNIRLSTDGSIVDNGFRAKYKQLCNAAPPDVHNYKNLRATNTWQTLNVGHQRQWHLFWKIRAITAGCRVLTILKKLVNSKLEFCDEPPCSNLEADYRVHAVDEFDRSRDLEYFVRYKTGGNAPATNGGFSLQYKQHCPSSPTFDDLQYNAIKTAGANWQTASDVSIGVPHKYQNEYWSYIYSWLIKAAHPERDCRPVVEFLFVHDMYNDDDNAHLGFEDDHLHDTSLYYIGILLKSDSHPRTLTFRYKEQCP